MKHYINIPRSYTDTYLDSVTCDICNKTYNSHWNAKTYQVLETEVRFKRGESYPEGGGGSEISYDICPKCFDTVLVPLLESKGITPSIADWETG